eukprot:3721807-Rhodomonas_salina.1
MGVGLRVGRAGTTGHARRGHRRRRVHARLHLHHHHRSAAPARACAHKQARIALTRIPREDGADVGEVLGCQLRAVSAEPAR